MLFASNCCHFEVKYTTIHWSIHCIHLRGVREQKQFPEPSRPQQSTSPHFSIVLHSLAITPLIHYTATGYRVQAITALLHCHRVLANWKFSIFQTNHPSISIFYSLSILLCLLLIDFFQAEVLCQVKVPSPSQTKLRKSEYLFQGRDQYQTLSLKHRVQWSAVNKEKVQPSSLKTPKRVHRSHTSCAKWRKNETRCLLNEEGSEPCRSGARGWPRTTQASPSPTCPPRGGWGWGSWFWFWVIVI